MKSMQLLWQTSPVTNEEDEVLQEKESARQDCSIDPALAKEYVRALKNRYHNRYWIKWLILSTSLFPSWFVSR